MKRNMLLVSILVLVLIISSGCITTSVPRSSKCPLNGTDVPFAKLVTPGFAEDYVGCNITTIAQFVAPGAGAWILPVSTTGKAVFRVLPQGVAGEKNPLSGEIQANFVVIPKEAGDLIYSLKAGDLIKLTGGTYVEGAGVLGKISGLSGYTSIVFIANTMEKVQQK